MTYVLKTLAITNKLVPLRGEHREYSSLRDAFADAKAFADADGVVVYVLDFAADIIVGTGTPLTTAAA